MNLWKKIPPSWKIRRELQRLGQQLRAPFEVALSPLSSRIYQHFLKDRINISNGLVPLKCNVALFLIYAPGGLYGSHLHTLKHLCDRGFSVLLVANHPLPPDTRKTLQPYVWRFIERPNFGYDFGGYRDGILHLDSENIIPDHLLVLNDSIWFPIYENDTLIDDMLLWSENIRGFGKDYHKRSNHRSFVQSYFFMYNREILKSHTFIDYWRSIILSSNKHLVIRRLEMGMSAHFERHGFSVRCLHDYSHIGQTLKNLPLHRKLTFLEFEADRLGTQAETIAQNLMSGKDVSEGKWAELGRLSQIDGHVLKLPPELLIDVLNVSLIKKLRQPGFAEQRQDMIAKGFHKRMAKVIRDEIMEWDKT
jgi:hypothetical protein